MADELEVLEKQQLSAQRSLNDLTDQLTLADHLVYKKYLTELQNYDPEKGRRYVPEAFHGVLFQHGTRL